ncbi:glycosyltransferase [Pelagicoccus mobilis]|uniref:Glycosyltransferase family 2 protein n=1 Tax=Pelagicoccus mobilis TaxID=415221 RepID=A0A934RX50_9BACT|nr:glycosyltransferase family 2 protein [Pelagicoccus mobilis]MBK1877948.1 glycosyltransferase family 2 protein [Pelagicoccus mobilis]
MKNYPDIAIVIATCKPTGLLERTIKSLVQCVDPPTLRRIIIAENGPVSTAAELVDGYKAALPIEHHFYPNAKKCGALNRALAELDDELIVYFDDDVRIHPETLLAYAEAAKGATRGAFFGGRCKVDYEEEPEGWLGKYLPAAAKGWAPSKESSELVKPGALGFNWAAFAEDLREIGGYDERCGPGTLANADEMNVQQKLLENGVRGYYLPDAIAWHYVPPERCSEAWLLQYIRKGGAGKGIAYAEGDRKLFWKQQIGCRLKLVAYKLALPFAVRYRTRFHCEFKINWLEGKLEGMKLGIDEKRAPLPSSHSPKSVQH